MPIQKNGILFQERHSYLDPNIRITHRLGAVSVLSNFMGWFCNEIAFLIEGIGSNGKSFHILYSDRRDRKSKSCSPVLYSTFFNFLSDYRFIKAFSLWKVEQKQIMTLLSELETVSTHSPYCSRVIIEKELEKIGIKVKNGRRLVFGPRTLVDRFKSYST